MKKRGGAKIGLDTSHYDAGIVSMMDSAENCLCCGTRLKYTDKNKSRNRGYCSLDCYYKYPPKMAYIEHVYTKPARQAIIELLNDSQSMEVAAGLLGISKWLLYDYIKKLGIKQVTRYE